MASWVKIKDVEAYANLDNMIRAEVVATDPPNWAVRVLFAAAGSYVLDGLYPTQADAEQALRDLTNGVTLAELTD